MTSSPVCPKCGGMMTTRTRKSDGAKFWGCRMFPACTGSRNYNDSAVVSVGSQADPGGSQSPELVVNAGPKKFVPSVYQAAMFEKISNFAPSENAVVEACAGSGKTTSITISATLLPKNAKTVVLVFNRHNVAPVREKIGDCAVVMTYHSLAFAACRKAWGGDIRVDERKVDFILENILNKDTHRHLFQPIKQLVSLVKANLLSTTLDDLNFLVDYHGIELNGDADVVFQAVEKVIARCMENTHVIDYDDMCWLPIVHDVPFEQYDYVYVDEAQDTNRNQIAVALKAVTPGGHVIAVGDRFQSMYGFRGADADAIPNLISSLDAVVLPLSISYRAPKCVVRLVNEKFPEIAFESWDKAIEGEILHMSDERALDEYKPGDMVLCRVNAPLVAPVFELIRRGVKATIRGRDIGKGLITLIKKMKTRDIVTLIVKLEEYKDKEVTKLTAAEKNQQAATVSDKVDTIIALSEGVYSVSELEHRIEKVFSDTVEGVVFSTVHRAKGLEAKAVYILKPELLPHPMAKKEWEKVQERNIEYVALTRTLNRLVYVHG